MATAAATPPPPPTDSPAAPRSTKAQTVIDAQLLRTRRQVKGVDMAAAMLTLAVGALGYLLGAAVLDHWLIPGGLGFWGRLLLLLGLCGGAVALFALRVLPLLVYRINPLFAAHTIEENQPSLKNSVVNFLLLRGHRREMPAVVYQALQQRAARDLAGVPVETVVDRTHAMRLGYALVVVLAVCCLYTVISPKSPFISVGRVVWPWANIAAPTRVTIEDVKVGDEVVSRDGVAVSRGDVIAVSAVVRGLDDHEKVTFYYTMADEQSVNEAIPMEAADGRSGHYYELPPDSFVARQDAEFYLAAGDCKTRVYRIEVRIAPAITLDSVTYDYPKYTGIPDKTVEKQGDLRAVEGTRVTIRATANLEIGAAEIDLDCNRRRGLAMEIAGRSATRQFPLRMRRDDPLMPEHESYQLRFTDADGRENRRPARYRIQVIPDLAPRVMLQVQGYDTLPDEIQVPVDESVLFQVAAEDPDFGLQSVTLLAEVSAEQEQKKKRRLPIAPLFAKPSDDDAPPHRGPLEATYRFEPARLQLAPGDVVIYWAEAKDNKEPAANRQETRLRQMVIVGPGDPGQPKQGSQQPENAQQPDTRNPPPKPQEAQPDERPKDRGDQTGDEPAQEQPPEEKRPGEAEKPAEKPGEKPEPGQQDDSNTQPTQEQQEGAKQGDAEGQQPSDDAEESQRVDPEGNPSEAFEQLLEDQQQQQEKNDAEQKPEQKPDEGAQPKPGDSPSQDDPAGAESQPKPGKAQQQPGDGAQPKPDDAQPQGEPAGGDSQSKPGDAQQQGDPTSDGAQPKPGDSQQPGDPAGGGSQSKPAGDTQQQGDPTSTDSTSKPGDTPQQGDPAGGESPSKAGDESQPKPGDSQEKPSGTAEKGSQPGEKPQQRVPDNDQSGTESSDPARQPKPGEGAQSKGHGEPEEPKEKGEPSTAPGDENATGGDSEDSKGEAGAGKPSEESTGTPSPQHDNMARDKQPGGEPSQESGTADEAKSPSNSPKDSDSKDGSAGDRSGGGEEGGGQHANQQGTGAAGTHTESDQGANAGSSKGEGETGTEAGDQVEADKRTGKSAPKPGGAGSDSRQKPGTGAGEKPQQQDQANPSGGPERKSDQAGPGRQQGETDQRPNAHGSGNPASGGKPREGPQQPPTPPKPARAADDPNLQYAREATDMALEHLRDQLAEENPQVLEKLKWTREDAEKFLRRWEQLKRRAANGNAQGAEQAKLNEALQNLGLRPRGAGLDGDRIKADQFRRMREARDLQPPPEWAEKFRAFEMGKSGQ